MSRVDRMELHLQNFNFVLLVQAARLPMPPICFQIHKDRGPHQLHGDQVNQAHDIGPSLTQL